MGALRATPFLGEMTEGVVLTVAAMLLQDLLIGRGETSANATGLASLLAMVYFGAVAARDKWTQRAESDGEPRHEKKTRAGLPGLCSAVA